MRRGILLTVFTAAVGCGQPAEEPANASAVLAEVNAAATSWVSNAHAYDYDALRASATPDFEILIFGQRLDLDGFIGLLQRIEDSRGGEPLIDYKLEAFNTEIVGEVAYTTWGSPDWLEYAILVRGADRWLMDRSGSVPVGDSP